ncbi:MAG: type 4a pilus biogenesis protein PilO [Gammaproteobacteria bacterium]|nr:type 4a pilus biogenesis protein PilO [Gammaproteobacteria bacterium]
MNLSRFQQMEARERNMLALGVISVIIAALIVYLVLPAAKDFRNKYGSRATLVSLEASGNDLGEQIDIRLQALEDLSRRLHGDSANLPLQQMEAFVIGRLQTISWDNQVELVSVEPVVGESIERFNEVLFKLEMEGGYEDIHRWLWSVREQLGFIVIKEFSLSRADQRSDDPRLRARLTIASYRMVSS